MIAPRHELHRLGQRALCRALLGGAAAYTLAVQLVAQHMEHPYQSNHLGPILLGLFLGALAAVRQKQRIGRDLLESRPLEDSLLLGLPFLAVCIMLLPGTTGFAPCAAAILAARAVTLLQEAAVLAVVSRALNGPRVDPLPKIRSLVRPAAARPPQLPAGVALAPVALESLPRCPVCATEIERAPVSCGDCATPHHTDCFRYNGKCGLYACGGLAATDAASRPVSLRARARAA